MVPIYLKRDNSFNLIEYTLKSVLYLYVLLSYVCAFVGSYSLLPSFLLSFFFPGAPPPLVSSPRRPMMCSLSIAPKYLDKRYDNDNDNDNVPEERQRQRPSHRT